MADCLARRAGRRRRAGDAARGGVAECRVPRQQPRSGPRDLRRSDWVGDHRRTSGRGDHRATSRLGGDLLGQRADRSAAPGAGAPADHGIVRARRRARPSWPGASHRRRHRAGLGSRARQRGRLGQCSGAECGGGRRNAAGGLRRPSTRRRRADASPEPVRVARVLCRHGGESGAVRRPVRLGVLPGPVPSSRTRLFPPGGRAAADAVDCDTVRRRPAGGCRRRPPRRSPRVGGRAHAERRRTGLDRGNRLTRPGLPEPGSAAPRDRYRRLDGDPCRAERRTRRRFGNRDRQVRRREQHDARTRRRLRRRSPRRRFHSSRHLRLRPSFVRGFGAAMGVSAALAAVAALAALAVPGRGPDYADDTSDAGDTDAATRSRTSRGAKA